MWFSTNANQSQFISETNGIYIFISFRAVVIDIDGPKYLWHIQITHRSTDIPTNILMKKKKHVLVDLWPLKCVENRKSQILMNPKIYSCKI